MSGVHDISQVPLTLDGLETLLRERHILELPPETVQRINLASESLHHHLQTTDKETTGVIQENLPTVPNRGQKDPAELAHNLLQAQAGGAGPEVTEEVIRLMLLLKIRSLASGYSGIRLSSIKRLLDFYNREVYPVVYAQGAPGPQGDSVPLAHLALPLIGKGEVRFQTYLLQGADVLSIFSWDPLPLSITEVSALVSGSHFTLALALDALLRARRLSLHADVVAALSFVAFEADPVCFSPQVQMLQPHPGQVQCAARFRSLLEGYERNTLTHNKEPDPYSFRCLPQVHGASWDALAYVSQTFQTQLQAITETPTYFLKEDILLDGGNFHSQPQALALEVLGLAVSGWAGIAEKRIGQLVSGKRGLPAFLQSDPAESPALWAPHQTAISLLGQINSLCGAPALGPVAVGGQADHLTQGANAAQKAQLVVQHWEQILATELYTATHALALKEHTLLPPTLENWLRAYRQQVSFVLTENPLHLQLQQTVAFLRNHPFAEPG